MAQKQVAVIIGSGRGIGLELSRLYLTQSNMHIVALSRDANAARKSILDGRHTPPLKAHIDGFNGNSAKQPAVAIDAKDASHFDGSRLTTLDVDIKHEDSIQAASEAVKKEFGEGSLRMLFNVSGILRIEKNLSSVKYEDMLEQFQINAFAPLLAMKHFTPLFPRKFETAGSSEEDPTNGLLPHNLGVVASMSARVGSIADNEKGGWYNYRSSKAALNQMIRCMGHEFTLRSLPAIAVGLHPGTVRTALSSAITGGPGGPKGQERKPGQPATSGKGRNESDEDRRARGEFEAEEAASRLAGVIARLKTEDNGKIWDYAGKQVPY